MSVSGQQLAEIEPTGEQLVRARERAQKSIERYRNDGDLGRDEDDWKSGVFIGAVGEILAAESYFQARGFDAEVVDDAAAQDYDLTVEGLTVEVKTRKQWAFPGELDLLLRFDEVPSADVYVLVEAIRTPHGRKYLLTKWASRETVADAMTDFREDRPQVPRAELRDIDTLLPLLKLFRDRR